MQWWIKVTGTGDRAYTQERWNERRARMLTDGRGPSLFPRRPRIEKGDRLVLYASGSAHAYGEARIFAIEEVISPEPEPSGHERWKWTLETKLLAWVDELGRAPALREIGIAPRSLSQHSHIRITSNQGALALSLIREVAPGGFEPPTSPL